jgi:hypothetical protein
MVSFGQVCTLETCGLSHSLGTLRVGYALRRPARTKIVETGKNKAYFLSISSSSSRVRLGSALPPVRRIT